MTDRVLKTIVRNHLRKFRKRKKKFNVTSIDIHFLKRIKDKFFEFQTAFPG